MTTDPAFNLVSSLADDVIYIGKDDLEQELIEEGKNPDDVVKDMLRMVENFRMTLTLIQPLKLKVLMSVRSPVEDIDWIQDVHFWVDRMGKIHVLSIPEGVAIKFVRTADDSHKMVVVNPVDVRQILQEADDAPPA